MKQLDDKEKRYIITLDDFQNIDCYYKNAWLKIDWYFPDHRIRRLTTDTGDVMWFKINKDQDGIVTKEKSLLKEQDVKVLDATALFKLETFSKRPKYKDTILYIEEVSISINGVLHSKFYSTETESDYDENFKLPKLKLVDGSIEIKSLGHTTLREYVTKLIGE